MRETLTSLEASRTASVDAPPGRPAGPDVLSRSLLAKRQQGALGVIAEVKRRRFRGADLLRGRSPAEIARVYQATGAAAISVVTSPWFGGSIKLLEEVAAANLGLPILRKDLIGDERAIVASKRAGASAVLLPLALLGVERLIGLVEIARGESLEPFVEVATHEEIEQLRERYDGLIAINNSDLKTNEIEGADISRSLALIDRRERRVWVSASRIGSPEEVRLLAAGGFDGILIGTHLLAAGDLRRETEQIVAAASTDSPKSDRPLVKICGVTSAAEVEILIRARVDFFGLVVDVPSPWTVSSERARELAALARGPIRPTLVGRHHPTERLMEIIRQCRAGAVQLGPVSLPGQVRQLRQVFAPQELTIIQTIPYDRGQFRNESLIDEYLAAGADLLLLDVLRTAGQADRGASASIPPAELMAFQNRHPAKPILVAGGVSADNVETLMAASGATGIDVCSSVRRAGQIRAELVDRLVEHLPRRRFTMPEVVNARPSEPDLSVPSDNRSGITRPSLNKFLRTAPAGNRLIAYLTLGDPAVRFIDVADEILAAGALCLELGVPHPRPNEGEVLRESHRRALAAGIDQPAALAFFETIAARHPETPLIGVIQYSAISAKRELHQLLDGLAEAGAAAVLPVGLSLWQLPGFASEVEQRGMETVYSCPPGASAKFRNIALRYSRGSIYVPRGRQTGGGRPFEQVGEFCRLIARETDTPLIVGVGVRTRDDVAEIGELGAKAAAVGSALVAHLASGGSAAEFIRRLISD